MELLQLDIITPEGSIFSAKVKSVILPGEEGEFGVFPGHSDILTLLSPGVIEIEKENGAKELVAVDFGYVKVNQQGVDVLADGAVALSSKDGQIAAAINEAKTLLEQAKSDRIVVASIVSRIENAVKNV